MFSEKTTLDRIISNAFLKDFLRSTDLKGCDIQALLKEADIPVSLYTQQTGSIDGIQLNRLSLVTYTTLEDTFYAIGSPLHPDMFNKVFIKILAQTTTVREALKEWQSFFNIVQDNGVIETIENTASFTWKFTFRDNRWIGTHIWVLSASLIKLKLFSWMAGKLIKLQEIGFSAPPPASADEFEALLGCKIKFSQPYDYMKVESRHLDALVIRSKEDILSFEEHIPKDFFSVKAEDQYYSLLLEKLLSLQVEEEFHIPTIQAIADRLNISVRSLRRKLENEGSSFQALKSGIRYRAAKQRLLATNKSVTAIAMELGFAESSSFTRAFRSRAGVSPELFRDKKGQLT